MKKYLRDYVILFSIAGVVIILDQWTKAWVRANLQEGGFDRWVPWSWLEPYARVIYIQNTGAAFGMLQGFSLVFTVLAVVVTLGILYYYPRLQPKTWPVHLSMGLMLAGAAGNLIDRLTQGGRVTDFISVGSFAIFNIADASISVGVAILLLTLWLQELREKKARPITHEEESFE